MNHSALLIERPMPYSALIIPTGPAKNRPTPTGRRTNAKLSSHSFSLGLDTLTHLTLMELQKAHSTPKLRPSRTLIVREAILRYGLETRAKLAQGDREWMADEATALMYLGHHGAK